MREILNNKETVLYARVSTTEQAENGFGLSYQVNRLMDYCKAKEIREYELIVDDGFSAKNDKRPGYQKLLELLSDNKLKKLIFLKIDRISRNREDYYRLCKICLNNNVEMISLQEKIEFNAIGEFNQGIYIELAQLERKMISERVHNAYYAILEEKNEKGFSKYPFGRLPMGISKDKNKYLYYNDEIKIVREMFELDKKGKSYIDIGIYIEKKYGLKKGKNFIEDTCKKTLYRGYKEYKGEKWHFIEPITKGLNKDKEIQRKRRLVNHEYKLDKYLPNFYRTTRIQYVKSINKKRRYIYYINKKNKFKISEYKILLKINSILETDKEKILKEKERRLKKLDEVYILSNMSKGEYSSLKREINKNIKNLMSYDEIINLKIDDEANVELTLKNKVINFTYK